MKKPMIIAHRGDQEFFPENTMAAFSSAISKGADSMEFDVHFTKDEQIIVHHDHYLGRTENFSGYLGDFTFNELRTLDAGSWFDPQFSNERIPSLREVLNLGKGRIRFEIELRHPTQSFVHQVLKEINDPDLKETVEITSPHIPLLHHIKLMDSNIRTGVFFREYPEWKKKRLGQQHLIDWMKLLNAQVAHIPLPMIDEEFVSKLHQNRIQVHAPNLNSENEIYSAMLLGIDQFSTDKLALALETRTKTD